MPKDCRFCRSNALLQDESLFENASFYILGSIDPTRLEAVIIVPHRHVESPFEMRSDEWADMEEALAFAKSYLSKFQPDGFTIGWNVGAIAGQTVFHAHMHVFVRYESDECVGKGIHAVLKMAGAQKMRSG